MNDIKLTEDLDFFAKDGVIIPQENGESTLIQALFSDDRVNNQRGYWGNDIILSELWQYDQSRINQDTANEIREDVQNVCNKLVKNKIYDKINTQVTQNDTSFTIRITAYNKNMIVLDRKFRV
jgi:phage gp46-like protein